MTDPPRKTLVVESGVDDVGPIRLDRYPCVLGKSTEADVVLDNPYVSRRHAEIDWEEGDVFIRDLESKNGTYVNGVRLVEARQRLNSGDRIELGQGQVTLRLLAPDTTLTIMPPARKSKGDLEVDPKSRDVWVRGTKLEPPLSRKDFDLLNLLNQRRGEACSKDEIASAVWPERLEGDVADQDIEQYIRRIRLRIEIDPSLPELIITVRRYGYKLSAG